MCLYDLDIDIYRRYTVFFKEGGGSILGLHYSTSTKGGGATLGPVESLHRGPKKGGPGPLDTPPLDPPMPV